MWFLICFQLLVAIAGQVHGIELRLTAVNDGDICGKVRCVEDTAHNDDSIKQLTVRKQQDTDVVLVEMSQQQPIFTSKKDDRTLKGILATGTLSSYRADVLISLFNSEDCNNAEFLCEIVHVNKLGVERVSSSSGRINGKLGPQIQELASTLADLKQRLPPTTCARNASSPDTRYQVVYPTDGTSFYLCDTDGGWTVIQRRIDGKTDFYRNWSSYKYGFGTFNGDLWLGLERIHQITSTSTQELMITMEYNGSLAHAHYDNFTVSGEEDNYRLSIGKYTGTAGDSLRYHNNMTFSTLDQDNDKKPKGNCAVVFRGAWWYKNCFGSNLNGLWGDTFNRWYFFSGTHSVTMSEMKIRKLF